MIWDVARVEPLDQYTLHVELVDGRQGTVDMNPYLEKGVFPAGACPPRSEEWRALPSDFQGL